jgi:hypothetical protein
MTTLQQDIRVLIAAHGFEMVHTTFQEIMRQDYEFLSKIFKTVPAVSVPVSTTAPAPAATPASHEVPPTTHQQNKKMIRITVKKEVEEPPKLVVNPIAVVSTLVEEETPVEESVNTLEMPDEKPKFRSPTEMKRFQKEAEKKKRAELDAKGITVASLMTRENLKKWIEEEGKTYAWVAREVIGCAETLVSTMSKNYGIQSNISKRKGIIMSRA